MSSENETHTTDTPINNSEDQVDTSETVENTQPDHQWPEDVAALHTLLNDFTSERDALAEKLDKVMRAYAEAENKSKRAEKDKIDAIKFGPFKLARDILEVADNFERALKAFPEEKDEKLKEVFEGLSLTEKSLHQVLGRHDVTLIDTDNVAFNPNMHEAVTQIPQPDKNSGDILDVVRKGYRMGERLLRPAQVVTVS